MSATGAQVVQVLPIADALARRHAPKIVDPAHDRDDLRQAAALGIVKAAGDWNHQGAFAGWAWAKAQGEAMHLVRDQTPGGRAGRPLRTVSLDTPTGDTDVVLGDTIPAATAGDLDLRLTVRQAWDRLDEADRVALAPMLAGLSQREQAHLQGVHQMTVSRRQRAALNRLARMPEIRDLQDAAA